MQKLNILLFANNESKREKGLMFLKTLGQNECAFFIFPSEQKQSFWNKNVEFDIDVAFFNEDGQLNDIQQLKAHQEKPIYSSKAKFVIETNAGWFDNNNVKLGCNIWDLIDIEDFKK